MNDDPPSQPKCMLLELPSEIILEQIFPSLPVKDLATISQVNKLLHTLANDETLWLRLTLRDHAYHPSLLAPPAAASGWSKRVYIGLSHPRLFVWGSSDNSRLGVDLDRVDGGDIRVRRFRRWVDRPVEVGGLEVVGARNWRETLRDTLSNLAGGVGGVGRIGSDVSGGNGSVSDGQDTGKGEEDVSVVDLQAGGWSFTARDSNGGVWVWGQMDGALIAWRATSWTDKYAQVPEPCRIPLPCHAESISAGRKHLLVLDQDNLIWELRAWGRAYHHTSPLLTAPVNSGSARNPKHIRQISAGWNHSACLTSSGDIHVWYPFSERYNSALTPEDHIHRTAEQQHARGLSWGTAGDIVDVLEQIPPQPSSRDDYEIWRKYEEGVTPSVKEREEKVVKIASGLDYVVALKGNGQVWYIRTHEGEASAWDYLPHFSGPDITHITAQYTNLTSYSPSSIHHTNLPERLIPPFGSTILPTPLPGLQGAALGGKRIIQVACGDYHNLALTSGGQVWSWGQGDHGQLGTGKMGECDVPERVYFPGEPIDVNTQDGEGVGGKEDGDGAGDRQGDSGLTSEVETNLKSTSADRGDNDRAFVVGITAAGWQSGAIVLGPTRKPPELDAATIAERNKWAEGKKKEWEKAQRQDAMPEPMGPGNPGRLVGPGGPIFRVGFAGRGSVVGNVARRNWRSRQGTQGAPYAAGPQEAQRGSQGGGDGGEQGQQGGQEEQGGQGVAPQQGRQDQQGE